MARSPAGIGPPRAADGHNDPMTNTQGTTASDAPRPEDATPSTTPSGTRSGTSQDVTAWSADAGGASNVKEGSRVLVIGGGPGGYEAALVARQLGAEVTIVEERGVGGAAVLTDVVPSKTLIATAEWMTLTDGARELGIDFGAGVSPNEHVRADLGRVNERVRELAALQSEDIHTRLVREGIQVVTGRGALADSPTRGMRGATVTFPDGTCEHIEAHVILLATGAHPRELPTARPDGERILTWTQLYGLEEMPEHLVVVGSGVTGAEFASAYTILGSRVTLVSSRDRVLPGYDTDAADLLERVFTERGMEVLSRTRAESVDRRGDGVLVTLSDGREIEASHCLMAVGSIPNTEGLGLEAAGVRTTASGHIEVDRVSRTTISRIYAAGDCTGVLPLASVAAMQGRIAMWHALGDSVDPLNLATAPSNIFTLPEVATVGVDQAAIDAGEIDADITMLPLSRNPRAKMLGYKDGFIKLFSARPSGRIIGGVVVAPRAGELIFPIAMAMAQRRTVDDVSNVVTVYPSLTGSITEAARVLHDPAPEF